MENKFDAIVIGAGVIGGAVAFELARTGKSVCVIDKSGGAGQGSTSASSGVLRFTYSTLDTIALSWESFQCWLDWQNHLEAPTSDGLVQANDVGYLSMDAPIVNLERQASLFDQVGIEYEILTPERFKAKFPYMDTGKFWPPKRLDDDAFWEDATESLRAMYTTHGGYISDPQQAAVNLADAAARKGVVHKYRTEVVEIRKENGRVCCVVTNSGEEISAPVIVNVAGPWSGQINKLAGAGSDFSITTRPLRQEVHRAQAPLAYANGPCIADLDVGVYTRPELGNAIVIGGTEPECDPFIWVEDPDTANMTPTQDSFEAQVGRAARRMPELQVPSRTSGVVGIYDVSSDWAPIYDKTDVPGFYVAIGTSGNQFKNAPTAGQIMATLIDAVESGADHDNNPVHYKGKYTGLDINIGAFSRKREINENSTGTVMG